MFCHILFISKFRSLCDHHQGCKAIEACRYLIICGKTYFIQLYSFFWVVSRRLNFICRHFGALCSILIRVNLHRHWRWNSVFRNSGISNLDGGESPKRKNTTFRTGRKFETKNIWYRFICWIYYVSLNTYVTFSAFDARIFLQWEPLTFFAQTSPIIRVITNHRNIWHICPYFKEPIILVYAVTLRQLRETICPY
jgi:hypothetical protein